MPQSPHFLDSLKRSYSGGEPGLVVMGDDSCSNGRGFKSRHHILDGYFFTLICCKYFIVCLNRPKINEKRPGLAHSFFKKVFFPMFNDRSREVKGDQVESLFGTFLERLIEFEGGKFPLI